MKNVTLTWMDDTGAHKKSVNALYMQQDPSGYLDALRTGEMWSITLRDPQGRDITSQYI
jgi:hypothetical protein